MTLFVSATLARGESPAMVDVWRTMKVATNPVSSEGWNNSQPRLARQILDCRANFCHKKNFTTS